MARHNVVGETGEDVASDYLTAKGWTIIDRNFRRTYGEIDIVARETSGLLVFVEVKTVSYETANPAENMHLRKLKRLGNVIQVYLESKRHSEEWRLDLVGVFLDYHTKEAKISHIKNIVIGA